MNVDSELGRPLSCHCTARPLTSGTGRKDRTIQRWDSGNLGISGALFPGSPLLPRLIHMHPTPGPSAHPEKRRKESQTWGWKPGQGSFLRHSWGRVFLGQAPARSPNKACLQLGASLPTQGSCSGSTLFVVSPLEGPRRRPTGQLSHMASFSVT